MKRWMIFALWCALAAVGTRGQISVSGNLQTLGVQNATGANTYARFTLANYGGSLPVATNTNVMVSDYQDFHPNGSGAISGQIWGNDAISPAGTSYQICIFNNGIRFRCATYLIASALCPSGFNLNTATPIVTTVAAPFQVTGARSFEFTQITPSETWLINNNFSDPHPVVVCFDATGHVIYPDTVIATDPNDVTVTFTLPQAGTCNVISAGYLNLSHNVENAIVSTPAGAQVINGPLTLGGPVTANINGNATTAATATTATSATSAGLLTRNPSIPDSSVNNTYYASKGTGSDLGAKMNSVISACIVTYMACKYIIDIGGTISTAPSFPLGSIVECTATAPITLATTWPMNHRSVVYNFNGCQINYNQDVGNAAFFVGKNLSGVLTCNGTTSAAWVSGSQFGTLDVGDQLSIGSGNPFYVGTGSTATTLILTTACSLGSSQSYASTSLGNKFGVGNYPGSVVIRDLNLNYTGAGTMNNIGLEYNFVTDAYGSNITVRNFTTGTGMHTYGLLVSKFDKLVLDNDQNALILDAQTHVGIAITSNDNEFSSCEINNSPAGGKPLYITGASNGNHFLSCDFEGNLATVFGTIDAGSFKNRIEKCDEEVNGDGTSSSEDWAVNAADNEFIDNIFVGDTNLPASGIVGNTNALNTVLRDNFWISFGGYATAAASFSGSGYSFCLNNNVGSAPFSGCLANEDLGGNYTAVNLAASKHLNQTATKNFAGSCAMSTSATCTFTLNASFTERH